MRLLCVDGPGPRPVVGFVDGLSNPISWASSGRHGPSSDFDLVEDKPKIKVERWINVYLYKGAKDDAGTAIYSSKEAAIRDSKKHSKTNIFLAVAAPFIWEGGEC